jgi:hypothetical protein
MNTKFIPVLFEGGDPSHIPAPARDGNHYFARSTRGYEDLGVIAESVPKRTLRAGMIPRLDFAVER